MDTSIYLISQIIILLLAFGLLRSLIFGLNHALIKMPIKAKKRTQLQNYVLGGLILWLGIVSVGAWSGFFRNLEMLPPRILIVLLPPLIIIVWLMFSSPFWVNPKGPPGKLVDQGSKLSNFYGVFTVVGIPGWVCANSNDF